MEILDLVHLGVTTAKPDLRHLDAAQLVDMLYLAETSSKVLATVTFASLGRIVLTAMKHSQQESAHQVIIVKKDLQFESRRMTPLAGNALPGTFVQKVLPGPSAARLGNITMKRQEIYAEIALLDFSVLLIQHLQMSARLDIIALRRRLPAMPTLALREPLIILHHVPLQVIASHALRGRIVLQKVGVRFFLSLTFAVS